MTAFNVNRRQATSIASLAALGSLSACASTATSNSASSGAAGGAVDAKLTQLPTKAMPLKGWLAQPSGQPKIAVILLHELFGMEASIQRLAKRLSGEGMTALAVDAYTTIPAPDPKGAADAGPVSFRSFPDDKYILAMRELAAWFRNGGSGGVRHSAVYVWGFSMGGRFAHQAVALSDNVTGGINFYGRLNYPKMDTKAFNCLDTAGLIDRPYLAMFGEGDPVAPEADIAVLRSKLAGNSKARVELIKGAKHSFFNDGSPAYDKAISEQVWPQVLKFMRDHA
jgi:carboxymethylenebutenolidase